MVRRNMKRITIFLMTALMFLSFLYMMNTAYAEETGASSHEELAAAVRSTEGEIHIVLQDSFTLESRGEEPQIIIGSGKRVILEASGSDIILSHGSGGAMFFIEDGAQLIKKEMRARVLLCEKQYYQRSLLIAALKRKDILKLKMLLLKDSMRRREPLFS